MTDLREMLGTVSGEPEIDVDELAAVLQVLTDLDRDSTTCATAMMAHHTTDMVSATRAALDCADSQEPPTGCCPALPPATPVSPQLF